MNRKQKLKRRRWDAILVGLGMAIGFSVIIMKYTGYWPCHIIDMLQLHQISCDRPMQDNLSSAVHWFQQFFSAHYLLQFLHNI